jgi:hypothetical protein
VTAVAPTRSGPRSAAARLGAAGRAGAGLLRAHWLFALLLAGGAVLRGITFLAYRPALIYQDSVYYLDNAAHLVPDMRKPALYPAFLRILPIGHELAVVPFVQHVLILLTAVALYALCVRLGVRPWLAALAMVPLLFDAFQLLIEQYILSESLFEVLMVGAALCLLWRREPGLVAIAGCGLLLIAATLDRQVALVTIVPAAVALLFVRPRRSRWLALVVLVAAFVVPLGAYMAWFHAHHGRYALTGATGRFIYGRVAPFVDCSKVTLPADERPLCPSQPVSQRPTPHEYAWYHSSPYFKVPKGKRNALAEDFAKRVIKAEPLAYVHAVLKDFVHGFSFKRSEPGRRVGFTQTWTFQPRYPRRSIADPVIRAHGDRRGYMQPRLAAFLRGYQRFAFTPGPLLALGLIGGLLAAVGLGRDRPRRSRLRGGAFVLAGWALLLALVAAAGHQLPPRYVLPSLVMLPPGLVLGLTALLRVQPCPTTPGSAPPTTSANASPAS